MAVTKKSVSKSDSVKKKAAPKKAAAAGAKARSAPSAQKRPEKSGDLPKASAGRSVPARTASRAGSAAAAPLRNTAVSARRDQGGEKKSIVNARKSALAVVLFVLFALGIFCLSQHLIQNVDFLLHEALAYKEAGRYEKAIERLEQAERLLEKDIQKKLEVRAVTAQDEERLESLFGLYRQISELRKQTELEWEEYNRNQPDDRADTAYFLRRAGEDAGLNGKAGTEVCPAALSV